MTEWTKLRIVHGLIAFVIASIGSVAITWLTFWGSMKWFVYLYPHDGQDVLGAVFVGIIVFPISWGIVFWQAMKWQWVWAWRKQEAQRHGVMSRVA